MFTVLWHFRSSYKAKFGHLYLVMLTILWHASSTQQTHTWCSNELALHTTHHPNHSTNSISDPFLCPTTVLFFMAHCCLMFVRDQIFIIIGIWMMQKNKYEYFLMLGGTKQTPAIISIQIENRQFIVFFDKFIALFSHYKVIDTKMIKKRYTTEIVRFTLNFQ